MIVDVMTIPAFLSPNSFPIEIASAYPIFPLNSMGSSTTLGAFTASVLISGANFGSIFSRSPTSNEIACVGSWIWEWSLIGSSLILMATTTGAPLLSAPYFGIACASFPSASAAFAIILAAVTPPWPPRLSSMISCIMMRR